MHDQLFGVLAFRYTKVESGLWSFKKVHLYTQSEICQTVSTT